MVFIISNINKCLENSCSENCKGCTPDQEVVNIYILISKVFICFGIFSVCLPRPRIFRCKIVDKHLSQLCEKHYEARFIRLNAEKAPFLTERLKIKVMPTVLMAKDAVVCDRLEGLGVLSV